MKNEPKKRKKLNWWQQIILVAIIGGIIGSYLGKYGVISLVILIVGMAAFRLWKSRELFKSSIKVMEGIIFGKPLDKELWKKNEMKNTKVKIVWGKKYE